MVELLHHLGLSAAAAPAPGMASGSRHKLFVGNLPPDVTQDELSMVMNTYGTCVDIHLMVGKSRSGQSCAFVSYDSAEGAASALGALNGVYSFRGAAHPPVTVSWAKPQGGPGGDAPAASAPFQFVSPASAPQWIPPLDTALQAQPQLLAAVAGQPSLLPGGVSLAGATLAAQPQFAHLMAPAATVVGAQPQLAQYAAAAAPAQPQYAQYVAVGAQPQLSASLLTAAASLSPSLALQTQALQGRKLFIGNLPADIQQDALRIVFSHYGQVTNIHCMGGKSRSGQACAFIEYATPIEAETAILTLHEKYEIRPGEGNIIVKYASSPQGGGQRAAPY